MPLSGARLVKVTLRLTGFGLTCSTVTRAI